jgi:cell wall-associated NlpC family hydrolase
MNLDPRLHAWRSDLADARLKGKVEARRFVAGTGRRVVAPSAPLKLEPRADAPLASEILRGEVFTVFEDGAEGWSWGQLQTDSYVGFVPTEALGVTTPEPTHRVVELRTFIYPGPDMKLPQQGVLSIGSSLALDESGETRGTEYRRIAGGEGWVVASTVAKIESPPANDFVAVAERFLNTAYLWGGRTSVGLDCSALVQLSLMMAGVAAPRDTDLQETALGEAVEAGARAPLQRGDLVFWKGHVGIMIDGEYLLHANGHHMATVIEPLEAVDKRIAAAAGPATAVRRMAP